jgi:uncharacterized membrane protein (DUF2068 family)
VGKRGDGLVVLIGILKLLKSAALLALGVGAIMTLPQQLASGAERVVNWLGLYLGRGLVERELGKLATVSPSVARWMGLLALGYAAVFLIEGAGLLSRKRWAEWMTVLVTTSFIPLEIYEMIRRFGVGKVTTLVLNVAIVAYLARRRLEERGGLRRMFRRRPHLSLVAPDGPFARDHRAAHP